MLEVHYVRMHSVNSMYTDPHRQVWTSCLSSCVLSLGIDWLLMTLCAFLCVESLPCIRLLGNISIIRSGDLCLHFSGTDSGLEQSVKEEQQRRAEAETQVQLPKERVSGEFPTSPNCCVFIVCTVTSIN